jgi:hypothetical protein
MSNDIHPLFKEILGAFVGVPKEDIVSRLREYGNRRRTSWEAAALCVAAVTEIERLRNQLAADVAKLAKGKR